MTTTNEPLWDLPLDPPPEPVENAPLDPQFRSATEWLEHWLLDAVRFDESNDHRWCPQWWAHHEAYIRITALWLAWEQAEIDTTDAAARSTWWLHHFDPHWHHLTSQRGPFRSCSTNNGHLEQPEQRPTIVPPEELE